MPPPPNMMDTLEDIAHDLRELNQPALAGEIEATRNTLRVMLDLTRWGDCLFGDEIRNLLGIRHSLRPRRGTPHDPLRGKRKARRIRR